MKKPITDWNKFREQFVRWTLRRASFRWPPRGEAMKASRVGRGQYQCAQCKGIFKNKEVKLDHTEPVVPIGQSSTSSVLCDVLQEHLPPGATSFNLGQMVLRMFPEASGFQVLCAGCHQIKTNGENDARRQVRTRLKAPK